MNNDNINDVLISQIIYSNFITYNRLSYLTRHCLTDYSTDEINIFINMDSIVASLMKRDVFPNMFLFTSSILNMAAHMRSYYWTRHHVISNIYIVTNNNYSIYSDNSDRLKLLSILVPYFPRVYLIKTNSYCSVAIKNIVNRTNPDIPSIVITKDKLSWQLPDIDNRITIFRPKKTVRGDESFYINSKNCILKWVESNSKMDKNLYKLDLTPKGTLGLYISYSSFIDDDMKLYSYYQSKRAMRLINDHINNGEFISGYNSPLSIKSILDIDSKPERESLYDRYSSIDINRLTQIYQSSSESKDTSWYINKNDINAIKNINNKYFYQYPIDIIRLYDMPV